MSSGSYITTRNNGKLLIEGTVNNKVTITGPGWKYIKLESDVKSEINHADISTTSIVIMIGL